MVVSTTVVIETVSNRALFSRVLCAGIITAPCACQPTGRCMCSVCRYHHSAVCVPANRAMYVFCVQVSPQRGVRARQQGDVCVLCAGITTARCACQPTARCMCSGVLFSRVLYAGITTAPCACQPTARCMCSGVLFSRVLCAGITTAPCACQPTG